ncbi:MAG: TonB family protein [Kofleriaceae bacterium]|nr:TonB family protein [Kofleriaceae bacterium]
MHCPHCQGEIPPNSQFCGVCGNNIVLAEESHATLFDLPVSTGARRIRIALLLGLNAAMLAGGIGLAMAYKNKRDTSSTVAQGESATPILRDSPTATGTQEEPDTADIGVDSVPEESPRKRPTAQGSASTGGNRNSPSSSSGTAAKGAQDSAGSGSDSAGSGSDSAGSGSDSAGSGSDSAGSDSTGSGSDSAGSDSTGSGSDSTGSGSDSAGSGSDSAGSASSGNSPAPDASVATDPAGTEPDVLSPEEEAKRVRITASKVTRVVASHSGQLGRCYRSAQKVTTPDRPIEGVVQVAFSIQSDGSAQSVRVRSNSTTSPALGQCVVGLVRTWRFPMSPGPALDFIWPFEF